MSTPLVILAVILAICTFVLIPFMMTKSGPQKNQDQQVQGKHGNKHQKKKKKR